GAGGQTKLNYDVFAFDEPGLVQAFTERGERTLRVLRRAAAHEADHRHRRLLRAHHERPRGRTAERSYHFPPCSDRHVALPCEGGLVKATISCHKRAVFTPEGDGM